MYIDNTPYRLGPEHRPASSAFRIVEAASPIAEIESRLRVFESILRLAHDPKNSSSS